MVLLVGRRLDMCLMLAGCNILLTLDLKPSSIFFFSPFCFIIVINILDDYSLLPALVSVFFYGSVVFPPLPRVSFHFCPVNTVDGYLPGAFLAISLKMRLTWGLFSC